VQVNTAEAPLQELAWGMGVERLPFFMFFRDGQLITSFSANTSTVSHLRAEIASHAICSDPGCNSDCDA
jgi:hypothetical protein